MGLEVDEILTNNCKQYIDCFKIEISTDGIQLFICQVGDCSNSYSDKSGAIRHLRKHHKGIYDAVKYNKDETLQPENQINSTFTIRVKVDPEEIWDACTELVTVNGLPLTVVEYPAFQRILKPYLTALKLKGIDLIINRHNIKDRISHRAEQIKQLIMSETKNNVLCVLVDIASRYNRSVLGINVAFMKDDKICVRTIGMHVLRFSHTAANIKNMIMSTLTDYEIRLEQVIAIVSDNGKNITKSIALLDEFYQRSKESCENWGIDDSEYEEFIDNEVFDEEYYADLLSRVRAMFEEVPYTDLIHGVTCAAHCLHLVVTHAIKKSLSTSNLLEKCRKLAKKLRSPTIRELLKSSNLNAAILDVNTRWNSAFSMVSK